MGRRIAPDRLAVACLRLGTVSLRDFAAMLIAHASDGGVLDDSTLAAIRDECVRKIKNADPAGLSVEQEAEVIGKAVKHVEDLLDAAIRDGRERQR